MPEEWSALRCAYRYTYCYLSTCNNTAWEASFISFLNCCKILIVAMNFRYSALTGYYCEDICRCRLVRISNYWNKLNCLLIRIFLTFLTFLKTEKSPKNERYMLSCLLLSIVKLIRGASCKLTRSTDYYQFNSHIFATDIYLTCFGTKWYPLEIDYCINLLKMPKIYHNYLPMQWRFMSGCRFLCLKVFFETGHAG